MNLKCFFKHDWEQLGYVSHEGQLWENIRAKKEGRMRCRIESHFYGPIVNRICLRCGKVDDSLDTMTKKIELELDRKDLENKYRQKKAWEILHAHNRKSKTETKES
jgi:hypothetical protein